MEFKVTKGKIDPNNKTMYRDCTESDRQKYYNSMNSNWTEFSMNVKRILYETYKISYTDLIDSNYIKNTNNSNKVDTMLIELFKQKKDIDECVNILKNYHESVK